MGKGEIIMPKTIKENFFQRPAGESSTSKYIQTNTTNPDGSDKAQSVLDGTPDTKILIPQLKKDTNAVDTFSPDLPPSLTDLLAAALAARGFVPPLTPKPKKKEIAEPKPTGEKAEYGKIQVKENKAGFVEIRDETPGNVRKIDQHPTGTYDAMLDKGERIEKTTGMRMTMIDKDWEIVIFGNELVVISGDNKIQIKKNQILNITENQEIHIGKDQFVKIDNNQTIDVSVDRNQHVGSNETLSVDSNQKETIGGNHDLTISGKSMTKVSGNKNEQVGGNLTIIVTGPVNISSSAVVNISAPRINLGK
jgi:hypothetical protein